MDDDRLNFPDFLPDEADEAQKTVCPIGYTIFRPDFVQEVFHQTWVMTILNENSDHRGHQRFLSVRFRRLIIWFHLALSNLF